MRKSRTLLESFIYAISGIAYSLKTQRNMRIHFVMAGIVMLFGLLFRLSPLEMALVFFTISFVIICEMINTSIEATIDLFTKEYHPLAKIGKNVAAGAVLIAALNAIIVGYLIFYTRITKLIRLLLNHIQ